MAMTEFGTKLLSAPMLEIPKAARVLTEAASLVKTHVRCLALRFPKLPMIPTNLMYRYAGPMLFALMLFAVLASMVGVSAELAGLANFTRVILVAGDRNCIVEGEDDDQDQTPVEAERYHMTVDTSLPMMGTAGQVIALREQI